MAEKQKVLDAVLRTDFYSFLQRSFTVLSPGQPFMGNWHIEAMAHQLQRCYRGDINRLIITLPPRYLKSQTTSVAFTAWVLGNDPTRKVINVSYGEDLVIQHHIQTRQILESALYQRVFPRTRLSSRKNSQTEFSTTAGGHRLAVSVGGSLTGRGGNLIIIDDPHKAEEALSESRRDAALQWYRTTLRTRLDNSGRDVIVLVQQRLHEGDLAGELLETGQWTHLNLPVLAEEDQHIELDHGRTYFRRAGEPLHAARQPLEELHRIKDDMGSLLFAAQYQQRPVPLEGAIIHREWIQTYDAVPEGKGRTVQSWDIACKDGETHDWTACTTWRVVDGQCYLLHVLRQRMLFPELRARVLDMAHEWGASVVLIEDTVAGTPLIQDLWAERRGLNIVAIRPEGSKVERLVGISGALESGRARFPAAAPWLADLINELLRFPNGKHDDQVDSLTQFLRWERTQYRGTTDWAGVVISESFMSRHGPDGPWQLDQEREYPSLTDGNY